MRAKELFPAIQDETNRSQLLERLCSIKHVITTIHTLIEDTKYLEPCSRILKKILPSKSKGSLAQSFRGLHNGQRHAKVQTTDYTSENRTYSSGSHASWVAYRVLWLLALRHFPQMDGQAPRKDVGKCSMRKPDLQPQWWIELSALALGNGYRRIRKLYRDRKAADSCEIEDCVRRIRPSMEQGLRRRKVQLIYQIIGDPEFPEPVMTAPELTSDHDNCRPELSDRCGRPRTSTLLADEGFLFLGHIYSTLYDTTPKRYLTSFAITRDFFHSFFGTTEDDLDQPTTSFRLPLDNHGGGREDEGRMDDIDDPEGPRREDEGGMQDVDGEGPPANQRPVPSQPHEVPLPASPTRPVEDTYSAVTTPGERSPDKYRSLTRRGRSASPPTHSHRSGRRRGRSNSRDGRGLTSTRARAPLLPGTTQQLLLTSPPIEVGNTQADVSIEDMEIAPLAPPPRPVAEPLIEPSHSATTQSAFPATQPSAEDVEMVLWAPPSAGRLVGKGATIASRSRSLDGRRKITQRDRSTSPTIHTHRLGRRRERSGSWDGRRRWDLTSPRGGDIRDTIFPGAVQQLLPAGPPADSAQAAIVSSEDVSTEDMEVVPWAPPSAGRLVRKGAAITSRPRSLDGRRKIAQRNRSTSPTIHTHRSERRRQRSTSSCRERRRSRGSGTSRKEDTSAEDMEIVQWVPPPQTIADPLVEPSHSAVIPSASTLPAAQPSATPIFNQEIRDRTVSVLPGIQLSATPMYMFSEETQGETVPAAQFAFSQGTQGGIVSARPAQPAAATTSVLRQEIQDRTISALLATEPSAAPLFISGQEQLIDDITISLQDASRFLFRRQTRTARSFMVFSPAGGDRFRVDNADPTDPVSMANALQLLSKTPTLALASDQGKRLKLTSPTTILEEARAQKLDTALVVARPNAGEVIRQLEDFEEPDEELHHKERPPSLTVDEMVQRDGKPIQISIWDGTDWKTAVRNVTYSQTEGKVRYYMYRVKGVRPYDWEGTRLAVEECFHGAQDDSPPTVYLCLPEQASSVFPVDI